MLPNRCAFSLLLLSVQTLRSRVRVARRARQSREKNPPITRPRRASRDFAPSQTRYVMSSLVWHASVVKMWIVPLVGLKHSTPVAVEPLGGQLTPTVKGGLKTSPIAPNNPRQVVTLILLLFLSSINKLANITFSYLKRTETSILNIHFQK